MFNLRKLFDGRPTKDSKETIFIRESDWTLVGKSIVKKWGINGALDTGDELEVLIDVSFSKSAISGHIEPHISIFISPNTFGKVDGFITVHIALTEALVDYPFALAKIGISDDGSVIVTPMERQGAESAYGVLSEMKPFRILMIAESETFFQFTFPNEASDFLRIAKTVISRTK